MKIVELEQDILICRKKFMELLQQKNNAKDIAKLAHNAAVAIPALETARNLQVRIPLKTERR